ncbi:MAG TPA: DUF3311 domain-containing protein [Verrucomicrobiae bacterium]|jgi:hypothetical protein|nr:DUF3311 domain-containing protein [Verrucomicrobiae bacterium]
MKATKVLFLTLLIALVYFLHQDFWNWKQAEPFVFGFLPIGLAYHAGYSVAAAILMAVLVKLAWPGHLENTESQAADKESKNDGGHG